MFPVLQIWEDHSLRKPAAHMAVDEALLRISREPVIRFYRWDHPAVTFGYAQRFDEVLRSAGALAAVRRWTGGGTVFHGHDLTVALAIPHAAGFATTRAEVVYRRIHELFLQSILPAAPAARLALREDCRPGAACFESPALSDILWERRKICGGALRRAKIGILYQGSIHLDIPTPALAGSLASSIRMFVPPPEFAGLACQIEQEKYSSDAWNRMR